MLGKIAQVSRLTWNGVGSVRGRGFGDFYGSATVPPCQAGSSVASSSREKRGVRTVPSDPLDHSLAKTFLRRIGSTSLLIRRALIMLEKEHQWHRIIQVIKWMLSKGQGNTMGVYRMLFVALDMDLRAEAAHQFWEKKIGSDLHSVPWKLCTCMIGIYYRKKMLEHLVKLFKCLEAFDRKLSEKSVVQRVADAYEALGLPDEQKKILEKYKSLFQNE